jgi:hypothetical protein
MPGQVVSTMERMEGAEVGENAAKDNVEHRRTGKPRRKAIHGSHARLPSERPLLLGTKGLSCTGSSYFLSKIGENKQSSETHRREMRERKRGIKELLI